MPLNPLTRSSKHANHRTGLLADTIGSHLTLLERQLQSDGTLKHRLLEIILSFAEWQKEHNAAIENGTE